MNRKYTLALLCLLLLLSCSFAQDSDIEIEFLKPIDREVLKKGDVLEIEFKVTFPSGSSGEEVRAEVYSGPGSGERIDLVKNAKGNYAGEFQTSYEVQNDLRLVVFATAFVGDGGISKEGNVIVNFESVDFELDFELIPPEPYYLGTTIEKIKINAFYPDGSRLPLGNLERQPNLIINRESNRLQLSEDANGALVAELDYTIGLTEEFVRGGTAELEVELMDMVNDKYGNRIGMNVGKRFEIEDEHPSLQAKVKSPPPNERLFHNIDLPFVIELTKGSDVTNEVVYLTDSRDLDNRRQCEKVNGGGSVLKFQCTEKTPSMDEAYRMVYIFLVSADVSGRKVTIYKRLETEISNEVFIDLQFPGEMEAFDEVENRLEINFFYSRDEKLEGGSYNGTVNDIPVQFVWDAEEDAYVAEFDLKSLGEGRHELEFEIKGLNLENDSANVYFAPEGAFPGFGPDGQGGFDPLLIIIPIVVVFAIFTLVIWFLVLRKKKEETIDELKEEAATMKALLKKIEIDFYKRRLNEVEYKKMSLEAQTRLEKVTAKLNVKGAVKNKNLK